MLVCHHYRPEVGAPQRRWDAFVRSWRAEGHRVTVLTPLPHYPGGRLLPDCDWRDLFGRSTGEHGEAVIRVPFLPVGRRGGVAKLGNQALVAALSAAAGSLAWRPDVVVSSVPGPASIVAGDWLSVRFQIPHVLEFRDAWPDLLYEGSPEWVRIPNAFATWMTARQRSADAVVTVTARFAEILRQRGVHRLRTHHISNGIDVKHVPALRPRNRGGEPLRLLYLGTHGISQGLENAVRALAEVKRPVEARFIGDGTEKLILQRQAQELGAPIRFLSPVTEKDLWNAYAWADSCLVHLDDLPAFEHTVPSKLYEVLALGRHVTGVLAGEAADIVESTGGGIVVPPSDPRALASAIDDLATDPSSTRPHEDTRSWVTENASLDHLAKRFMHVLESVVPR